jgi:hypothetical protein
VILLALACIDSSEVEMANGRTVAAISFHVGKKTALLGKKLFNRLFGETS